MTIRWPTAVIRPQNISVDLAPRSLSAPASMSGVTQVVASDAGIWKVTFGNLIVRDRASVITHRAIAALLEGRLQPILVPICRGYQPASGHKDLFEPVPHSDDSPFDDDSEYQGGATSVQLTSNVSARAVSANIVVNYAVGGIEPGQHFSIGERMYRLRSVTFTTPTTAAITFRPPLREAASEGDFLEFDDPVVRCRLASDDAMDLELQLRRFGSPSVSFVEDL
jgi:hypothetical protein